MQRYPLVIFCGKPQVGKSTHAAYLADYLGVDFSDCSAMIYRELANRLGTTVTELRKLDKEEVRPQLIALGNEMTATDKGYFIRKLKSAGFPVIAGVRRIEELNAIRKELDPLVIWIERDSAIEDNTTITAADCDFIVDNNKCLHCAFQDLINQFLTHLQLKWKTNPAT